MKLATLSSLVVTSLLVACSSAPDASVGTSEHAAVSDIDHMIRRADGSFDVYCADGSVEHNVPASKVTADDVCHTAAVDSGAGACPGTTVPPAAAWKAPAAASTSCTAADIAFIQQQAQAGGSFGDLEAALYAQNMTCAQCVFTTETDATWGPIVYVGSEGNAFLNWGACFARATGGSDACGDAFHKTNFCSQEMCSACSTQEQLSTCYGQVFGDPAACGTYDLNTACGGDLTTVNQACATPWDIITSVCGGR